MTPKYNMLGEQIDANGDLVLDANGKPIYKDNSTDTLIPSGGKSITEQIDDQGNPGSLSGITSGAAQADIFKQFTTGTPKQDVVTLVPNDLIEPDPENPFSVPTDNEDFAKLLDSVKENGVLEAVTIRPKPKESPFDPDRYLLVSGERRWTANKLAGRPNIQSIIKNIDDDTAKILMVDGNLHRTDIPPMELARAYKIRLDAEKRIADRQQNDSLCPPGTNVNAGSKAAEKANVSRRKLYRQIKLLDLNNDLQEMTNDRRISVRPAVELSYLPAEVQSSVVEVIEQNPTAAVTEDKAKKLRELAGDGTLATDIVRAVILTGTEEQKPPKPALPKMRKLVKRNLSGIGKYLANADIEIDEDKLEQVNGLIEQIHQVLERE